LGHSSRIHRTFDRCEKHKGYPAFLQTVGGPAGGLLLPKFIGYLYNSASVFIQQMRVLGIDPGSETLGWGVVEGSGLKYSLVDFGTVRSNTKQAFSKRLLNVYNGVAEVIDKFRPDVVSIEEAFYAVNVSVAMKLGQVRGIVLLLAEQRSIEIGEYAPRLIKQTVVGYGNAEKQQVGEMVRILLRLKSVPTPHDAADALAIAICHFHHAGMKDRIERVKKA
jgi:crossover junction endodeoxyribonuclease RuvC